MTNQDLAIKQAEIHATAAKLSQLIGELVGPQPTPQIANAAFAAQSHLQDGLNRVSNIFMFMSQRTDENIEATIDAALKGGAGAPKLTVVEGGKG